jgi:hypothetical protein
MQKDSKEYDQLSIQATKEALARIKYKSECQTEVLNAYDKKLQEAKAEVERLTSDLQMEKENEDRLVRLHQDARNEVERLTKAGDAMLSEWASGDEKDAKNFLKALTIWNAAKEGKQS